MEITIIVAAKGGTGCVVGRADIVGEIAYLCNTAKGGAKDGGGWGKNHT